MRRRSARIRGGIRLAALVLLLSMLVTAASASPPPPSYRAQWAAPSFDCLNASDAGLFVATDSHSSVVSVTFDPHNSTDQTEQSVEVIRPPFLPDVSENFYYSNFTSPDTGEQYLVAIWYFDTWARFTAGKDELYQFFHQHGTATPIVLNLSPELAASSKSALVNLSRSEQWQAINATRYESEETSGDALTFATNYFPGENYYIAYYGVVGPTGLSEETIRRLHLLAMTSFSQFVAYHWLEFDPATPMTVPPSSPIPWTAISWLLILCYSLLTIAIVDLVPALVLGFLTATAFQKINVRAAPSIRLLLPPLVAICLIGVLAVIAPLVHGTPAGLIGGVLLAGVVAMGVLTPWPLFAGRFEVMRSRSAVFLCGTGTFFVVLLFTLPLISLHPNLTDLMRIVGALDPPSSSIAFRAVVLYLQSLALAVFFYLAALVRDLTLRTDPEEPNGQNSAEDEGR
ncbi:MAG: hypothetical protein ABFC89_00810 [Methanospirillum sp.]